MQAPPVGRHTGEADNDPRTEEPGTSTHGETVDADAARRRAWVRRRQLILAIERLAPGYRRVTGNPARYVAEATDASRAEWDWIADHIARHPELLTGPERPRQEWDRRYEQHAEEAFTAADAACEAGDYTAALDHIDLAGAYLAARWQTKPGQAPDSWDRARAYILGRQQAARQTAPAPPTAPPAGGHRTAAASRAAAARPAPSAPGSRNPAPTAPLSAAAQHEPIKTTETAIVTSEEPGQVLEPRTPGDPPPRADRPGAPETQQDSDGRRREADPVSGSTDSDDPTQPAQPSSDPFAQFTPAERVMIEQATADWAANYHGTVGAFVFGIEDAARYVSEGHLTELHGYGRHSLTDVWKAVRAHLDEHPEILATGRLTDQQRTERQQQREEHAHQLARRARQAYKAGNYPQAHELIDQAELAAPLYRPNYFTWDAIRDQITAASSLGISATADDDSAQHSHRATPDAARPDRASSTDVRPPAAQRHAASGAPFSAAPTAPNPRAAALRRRTNPPPSITKPSNTDRPHPRR